MNTMAADNPKLLSWVEKREQLHRRFKEVTELRDASQLAFLRGPVVTWTEGEIATLWRESIAHPASTMESLNHMYFHVPFCKSICDFCNYERLRPSSPAMLQGWLDRSVASIEKLAPAVEDLTFHSLYIGGGTPSILPAKHMRTLFAAIAHNFKWHPLAGRDIELDPAVVDEKRVRVMKDFGFDSFSFGIQTLDTDINERHNRGPQSSAVVERCLDMLPNYWWNRVTVDMLLGLKGTTPEQTLSDIETLMQHERRPSIDVFQLVPTGSYVQQHFSGSHQKFWTHMKQFEERFVPGLEELIRRHRYTICGDRLHHYNISPERDSLLRRLRGFRPISLGRQVLNAYKDTPSQEFWRRRVLDRHKGRYSYTQLVSQQQRPLNLLGIGLSARSHIFGHASFEYFDPTNQPETPGAAVYRGQACDPEIEYRTYLITQFRDRGRVDFSKFEAIFGMTLDEAVGQPLSVLASLELIEFDDSGCILRTDTAQSTADALMWLIPTPYIEFEVARILGLEISPAGTQRYFKDLPLNTDLDKGMRFGGVKEGYLQIAGGDQIYKLSLAPPMEANRPIRFVLTADCRPSDADAPALQGAITKLRAYFERVHGRPGSAGNALLGGV